jgi:RNA polymerase sigma factor (sigma-70 family)
MVKPVEPECDLEAVYREHGPTLWRSLYVYTGGRREIADDAVAESFARALAAPDRIRDPLPWLYRVAYRIASAEMKRERNRGEMTDTAAEASSDAPLEVLIALRRLSPMQRAAAYLHYQADRPVAEVARLLGTSTPAVKVHLFRARQRLRVALKEDDDD